ncbi:MAG: M16 family metallopeptidase, partial [Gemmatimonadales bacterium]
VDSAVTIGRLPNGLRYYIRENHRPEKRAELRLVVNAGSILEDPAQLGLAHFAEHMAFNGTEHFQKQQLVDYLEGIGMRFGADLNASTSFDETIYKLVIPSDSAHLLAQGFQILEDWAHGVSYDTTEIRKERGVVIEEWRLGQGAGNRMMNKVYPVLFKGSRYAERLPIGTKASLDGFDPKALVRFYREWYRPDLMAVIAVGDFDGREVERQIQAHFGRILGAPKRARVRATYTIPPRTTAGVVIATDKEATVSRVQVNFLRPARPKGTVAAYRLMLVSQLYSQILNERLDELAQRSDPPFAQAGGGTHNLVRAVEAFSLMAVVPDSGIARGLEAVLTEVERVERHGFGPSELDRAKRRLLRFLESAYAERDKAESGGLVDAYVDNFLTGEPIPSIGQELALGRRLMPDITLRDVNLAAHGWLGRKHRVVVVTAPAKPGVTIPPGGSLLALIDRVRRIDVGPYKETISDAPLVAAALPEAAITEETRDSAFGVTRWTLANGVKVILKPTDFKADEVLLAAYGPGGSSLVADSLYTAARIASDVVQAGGVGPFSATELQKKLSGARVEVNPYIGTYQQGLQGAASPSDLRTLFELVYLDFTAPRADSAAFQALRSRARTALMNRGASPAAAFQDTVQAVLGQYHPRTRPLTLAAVDSFDLRKALSVYRDRFADAGGFTFLLVGSFAVDSARPLVQRYLGNLPTLRRGEEPRDLGISPPPGVVRREVRKGIEPQSQTRLVFTGPFDYVPSERFVLHSVAEVLDMRLRQQLREERGGTYGASAAAQTTRVPRPEYSVSIQFGSAPDRVDELVDVLLAQIDTLRQRGATDIELAKVKETAIRERETDLRQNGFWVSQLATADQSGESMHDLLDLPHQLDGLTSDAIRRAAERYLDVTRYVRVTLLPETGVTTGLGCHTR